MSMLADVARTLGVRANVHLAPGSVMAHSAAGMAVTQAMAVGTAVVRATMTSTAVGMMTSTVALAMDVVVKMDMMAASTTRIDTSRGGFSRPKLNFPSFDGESDPLPWLTKCASYFHGMRTTEEEKVWMAALHLEGAVAEWYYALEWDHGILSWPHFSDFVNMRFRPPLHTNGMAELKDLRRMDTVDEYTHQFSLLLCHCNDLSMAQQVNMFAAGLGEPLRTDVELQSLTQLQTAMSLARAYER
jgi:hypothetical protein